MKKWVTAAVAMMTAFLVMAQVPLQAYASVGGNVAAGEMRLAAVGISQTTQTELEERILAAWESHRTTCDISSLYIPVSASEQVKSIYFNLLYQNARCFYVDKLVEYIWVGRSEQTGFCKSLVIHYKYSASKTATMLKKFDQSVDQIVDGVKDSWSDLEIALYLHDYLCTHCSYDVTLRKVSAYEALVEKSAICEGYALAYQYLLSQAGIESQIVGSTTLNHAWNLVELNGKYYHVDVTWDDPQEDHLGRASHTYFLKSTASFQQDGMHSSGAWTVFGSWNASQASSKTYDKAFWKNVDTPFSYIKGKWYAFNSSKASICRYTCNGKKFKQTKKMLKVKDKWYVWGSSRTYMKKKYTSAVSYGGKLYYSTPKAVYRMNPSNGKTKKIYTLKGKKAKKGYIYGLFITTKGKLKLQVAKTDTAAGKKYTVKTIKK